MGKYEDVDEEGVWAPGVPTVTTVLIGGVGGAEEEEAKVLSWKAVGDCGGVGTLMVVPMFMAAGEEGLDPGAEAIEEA